MSLDNMRDTVQWQPSTGDPKIPGRRAYSTAQPVMARKEERITSLGADRVSNLVVAVPPEFVVHAGDLLDGAEVLEVTSARDREGNILRWVCYAKA